MCVCFVVGGDFVARPRAGMMLLCVGMALVMGVMRGVEGQECYGGDGGSRDGSDAACGQGE